MWCTPASVGRSTARFASPHIARALCLFAVLGVSRVLRAHHASVRAQLKVVRCTRCKHKSWPDPQGPSRAAPGTCSTTTASAVSLPFHTLVCCGCFTLVPKRGVALQLSPKFSGSDLDALDILFRMSGSDLGYPASAFAILREVVDNRQLVCGRMLNVRGGREKPWDWT